MTHRPPLDRTPETEPTRVVAVIPARGGSEGIPRKNLESVGGLPLVVRSIRAAQAASTVDLVIVSTDDAEIEAVAVAESAMVVRRPPELATGQASSESAVLHALDQIAGSGLLPDVVVLLQCTSPFTEPGDIDDCVALLAESAASCAFTVMPSHGFLWRTEDRRLVGVNHDHTLPRQRRQDRAPEFIETGAVYAMDVAKLRASAHRFGDSAVGLVVDRSRAIEIDGLDDLEAARKLASAERSTLADRLPSQIDLIVLDFDGVLTDDTVMVDENGGESVRAHRGDGLGVEMLRSRGIPIAVLSRESNRVVAARCQKLGVECEQSVLDKAPALRELAQRHGASLANTIYVGNDITDVACLEMVGCGVVVGDAHPLAAASANVVLARRGGRGAVRELADAVLAREGT